MEKDITVTHMITGLTKVFSRTAIPDVLWLNEGPQFTAKAFQELGVSTPNVLSPKAEAAIKSIKN